MQGRAANYARFHRFYEIVSKQRACVYCGAQATTRDHFVPLSVIALITDALPVIAGKVLVPACGECNFLAGKNVFPTIAAKRRFIHEKLRRRHRRTLDIPLWSEEELDQLGYTLNDFVRAGLDKKQWLLARLAWRNTSNAEPVKLAAIRLRFSGSGRSSAGRRAVRHGTTKNDAEY